MFFKKKAKGVTPLDEFVDNIMVSHRDFGNEFIRIKDIDIGSSSFVGEAEIRFSDQEHPFADIHGTSWDVSAFVKAFFYASAINLMKNHVNIHQKEALEIIRAYFNDVVLDYENLAVIPFNEISKAFYYRWDASGDDVDIHRLIAEREIKKATGESVKSTELYEGYKDIIDDRFIISKNGIVFKTEYMR